MMRVQDSPEVAGGEFVVSVEVDTGVLGGWCVAVAVGGGDRVVFMGDLADSKGSFGLQPIVIRKQTRIEIDFILTKTLIQIFIP
jgi:hypothetical protein